MFVIISGVSGSGKSLIGSRLADSLDYPFFDADQFHPPANIEKMSKGIPLNDEDRAPWLETLRGLIEKNLTAGGGGVLACSALKAAYREKLMIHKEVKLVFLKGDYAIIEQRMKNRQGHYMKPGLLQSQFEALEEPESADCVIDIQQNPDVIVRRIRAELGVGRSRVEG